MATATYRWLGLRCGIWLLSWLAIARLSPAQTVTNALPAEAWVTNTARHPLGTPGTAIRTNEFANLHAEVVAGRIKIAWPTDYAPADASVTLLASEDDLGHWSARDWRTHPMTRRGANWEAAPPVDSLDVPLIYFVRIANATEVTVSPMRVMRPRIAGLEAPTRVFWPFLEGFEEQLESWQTIGAEAQTPALKKGLPPKHGKAALAVALAADKHSVTIGTTRLRGWQILEHGANGLRIWLRTRSGTGKARFTLLANAHSPEQVVSVFPEDTELNDQWQRVDLPLAKFPKLPQGDIDLFTVEFIGDGPAEFLADDFQLLGPWKMQID